MIHLKDLLKTYLKTYWKRLGKTSWRRFCKTSWHLDGFLKMCDQGEYIHLLYSRHLEDVLRSLLKTYDQGEYIRLDQDVFWRRRRKTSSRRLHQDECLLDSFSRSVKKAAEYLQTCKASMMEPLTRSWIHPWNRP